MYGARTNNTQIPAECMAREPTTNDNDTTRRTRQTPRLQHGQRMTLARSSTTNDNQTLAECMARETTTDDDDAECRRELRLIVALSMRLPTRSVHDQIQSRRTDTTGGYDRHDATIRQHGTNQRQDTAHTGDGDYQRSTFRSTTQPNNAR
ncbi:hypothetical protein EDB83DRAFT_2598412 [Lactarius deliciosus]|nr:hypothetical protein EDB83DRAFT_2598412 [Lactarius deliciosus]